MHETALRYLESEQYRLFWQHVFRVQIALYVEKNARQSALFFVAFFVFANKLFIYVYSGVKKFVPLPVFCIFVTWMIQIIKHIFLYYTKLTRVNTKFSFEIMI